jgi:catalase-peroxidase
MTTADMALKMDPIYEPISRRFHKDPAAFAAWFLVLGSWFSVLGSQFSVLGSWFL